MLGLRWLVHRLDSGKRRELLLMLQSKLWLKILMLLIILLVLL